jgi:metallo-beta-lactamase class B
MAKRTSAAFLFGILIGPAFTGCAPSTPESGTGADVETHIERARMLAAADLAAPFDFFCVPGNARGTNSDGPSIAPVQLFDNLFMLGNADTVVYAITTSDGIVLIDSGYPGTTETVIIPGIEALGLDPADVRLVLLGHGHADHYGGAAYFQDRYGARVGSADWTLMAQVDSNAETPPRRDLVVEDRVPIVQGDTRITPIAIPGHTDGSLALIFDVTDRGTRHTAGLFGGTILLADRITTAGLEQYVSSIERYVTIAQDMGVDVEIQNHPLFDATTERLQMLAARGTDDPHPFAMSTDNYARFWGIVAECMRAEIARRADDAA